MNTLELLQKYDVPGPRYTSYPTVPAWTDDVGVSEYQKALLNVQGDDSLSLYFHLPFCEKLCHFCGCFKLITKDHSRSGPYMDRLYKEVELVAGQLKNSNKRVSQIHLGGGTPNFISPSELAQLMETIRKHFYILDDAEIAIEMHPRTSTKEFCNELKKLGFNRVSLGVQSFDDEVQKLINRHQTFEQTKDMLDYLRELGFESFNFDLIYGLPGQTLSKFETTLQKTLQLNPDRLAVYSYAHVPWKSPVQRSFKDEDLPSPLQKLELFEKAYTFFLENGFFQVGMDHFAKKNDELYQALQNGSVHRNFMGYSTKSDAHQIGFGISSISYVDGHYFQNVKVMADFESRLDAGELLTDRGYLLSQEDQLRRNLITEIMCQMKVSFEEFSTQNKIDFKSHFKKELSYLKPFVDDGLVVLTDDSLQVTEKGQLTLRNIAMCFDEYLSLIQKNSKNPVFSRTV